MQNQAPKAFYSLVVLIHSAFPPLKWKKNPYLAGVLGFFFGIFGIGLYLFSLRDIIYSALMLLGFIIVIPGVGLCPGWAFLGVYGFLRVYYSNRKLDHLADIDEKTAKLHTTNVGNTIKAVDMIDKHFNK